MRRKAAVLALDLRRRQNTLACHEHHGHVHRWIRYAQVLQHYLRRIAGLTPDVTAPGITRFHLAINVHRTHDAVAFFAVGLQTDAISVVSLCRRKRSRLPEKLQPITVIETASLQRQATCQRPSQSAQDTIKTPPVFLMYCLLTFPRDRSPGLHCSRSPHQLALGQIRARLTL